MLRHILVAVLLSALPLGALSDVPARWTSAWPDTDFSLISVSPDEIFSGGPPKDGIPAIDDPVMIPAADVAALDPREPVVTVALDGHAARAYPIRYLMWHEIVNDRIADRPVTVTFCPLCNSALVFDGRIDDPQIDGDTITFGVSGLLRHSDMIMYDRQTESWWQQFTGEAIAGSMIGTRLTALPAWMESWQSFATAHPDGLVMAEPSGHRRRYGENPYAGYDSGAPFLYRGEAPPHGIDPVARVVRVGDRAWPLTRLAEKGELTEAGVRLTWSAGQASALDTARIGDGREVGDIRAFDAATGAPVVHEVVFAFAFHAFEPDGTWMIAPE